MAIIYRLTNTLTGKSYVGQTIRSLQERWNEHRWEKRYNGHLQKAFKKYGFECWDLSILENDVPIENLNDREVHWITHFNTFNEGYNSDTGGKNGRQLSKERKQHLSQILTGRECKPETRKKISQAITGIKRSEETKRLISLNNARTGNRKGVVISEETRLKQRLAKLGKKRAPYKKRIKNDSDQ